MPIGLALFVLMFIGMFTTLKPPVLQSATVTTGVTFTTNQLVQYYDLNNAINNASVSDINSGDITDGTIAAVDLGANSVVTAKILDGTILGTDIANRTLTTLLYGTNSIDGIGLNTNLVLRSGFWFFTNVNQTINFAGPSTTLTFSSNQINWAAVSGVTNSAGAADTGKVVKLNDSGVLDTSITPFSKLFISSAQTITAGGSLTLAHSLGGAPTLIQCRLKAVNAVHNYSVGDEIVINPGHEDAAGSLGLSIIANDSTNIIIRYGSTAGVFDVLDKSSGNRTSATASDWNLIVRAWR